MSIDLQIHVVTSVDAGSLPGVTDYQHSKHEMMYGCLLGIKGTYGQVDRTLGSEVSGFDSLVMCRSFGLTLYSTLSQSTQP